MKTPIFGFTATATSTSAVNFVALMSTSSSSPNSVESTRQTVFFNTFTFGNLDVSIATAPGTGKSYTFTLRKNGVDTLLSVVISDTNTSNTDNTHTVSVAAGDILDISITPSGTPASTGQINWNMFVDSGNSTHYSGLWGGAHTTSNLSTASAVYSQLTGASNGGTTWSATEATQQIVCPTSGTISNLYGSTDTAPGATKSYALALVQNGTPTALSATVSGTNTSGNDTTHSVTVSAGDTLSIQATPSGTPTVGRYVWGAQFTPTNAGESFFGFGSSNAPSTTTTQYEWPLGVGGNGYNSTEANRQFAMPAVTLTALYAKLGTAPGGATSRTPTIRQNGASSALTVPISGSNTTGNITGQSVSIAQGDLLSLQMAESGTPAADTNGVHIGVLVFISTGGTLFTQTLTASVSFTGSQTKQVAHPLTAGVSFAGSLGPKNVFKLLAASVGFTGSQTRAITKRMTASETPSGSVTRSVAKTLSSASVSFSGLVLTGKSFARTLSAALSFTGSETRQTNKTLTAGVSFTGVQSHRVSKLMTAGVSFSGSVKRAISKSLQASQSFTGSIPKRVSKTVSGSLSFTGSASRKIGKSLTAAASFTGTASRRIAKTLPAANVAPSGSISRRTAKSFVAIVSFSGSLNWLVGKLLTSTISFSGQMIHGVAHFIVLSAQASFNGMLTRSVAKGFSASLDFSGNLVTGTLRKLIQSLPLFLDQRGDSIVKLDTNDRKIMLSNDPETVDLGQSDSGDRLNLGSNDNDIFL